MTKAAIQEKQLILQGNMWSVMWKLSWPAIIAMVLYGLNAVLDAVFVGYYVGEAALAGVSVAYPLSQISVAFGSLIGVGAGAMLSISIGAKDRQTQERLLGNVNWLTIVTTVIYMILGLLFSTQLIEAMGGKGEALSLGDDYFRITVIGAFFWVYGLAANMMIRAEGRMKTAAWMMGLGLVVNVIVNYVFMGVLHFGVEGAAWGTNIAMFVYTLLGWIYFGKGYASFPTKLLRIHRDSEAVRSIIRLGMASLIMVVMNLVQAVIVFNVLSKYGTVADIAFYGVVYRVFTFLLTPIFGLMRALQPVIGINYGANQYERVIHAYKVFTVTSMALTLPVWIWAMIDPITVLSFMLTDTVFTSADLLYFRVYLAILPLCSLIFMGMTLFPSIDKGKPAAMIGIARQVVFYIPTMIIVPKFFGVAGVYYGSLAIDVVITLWLVWMVKKEFNLLRAQNI
ncbi:MATE family efflux transporter [Bacillus sp. Hm123]|uniref:MATE family efflux transporter n=1 Tax=Bacillus sp. Hm123 TaxID=3450745 RepID=UPI003F420D9F